MKKFFSALLALALVCGVAGSVVAAEEVKKEAGLMFKITDADGKEFTQENIKGNKTLVVFAQMACRQCRHEMDDLNKSLDKTKAPVYVVLVDMNKAIAKKNWDAAGYKIPLLFDPDFSFPEALGIRSTPATVILDKDLKVVFKKSGYRPGQIDDILEQL